MNLNSVILSNFELIEEKLENLFHDLPIKEYISDKGNEFSFILKRPCYEQAIKGKKFYLLSIWKVPYIDTEIKISPVIKIIEEESDTNNKDWFLAMELNNDKRELFVKGVLNKYRLTLDKDSRIIVKDVNSVDFANTFNVSNKRFKEYKKTDEILV